MEKSILKRRSKKKIVAERITEVVGKSIQIQDSNPSYPKLIVSINFLSQLKCYNYINKNVIMLINKDLGYVVLKSKLL